MYPDAAKKENFSTFSLRSRFKDAVARIAEH
jgi:hypothetical protein